MTDRKLRRMAPLSPEWFAEAYYRMNCIVTATWRLKFPVNVVIWSVMVPALTLMFVTGVFKHLFRRWFFRS